MSSRSERRLIFLAVFLFFLVGLFFIEQQPKKSEQSQLFSLIHDLEPELPLEEPENSDIDPCTVFSPLKGFIDLRGLSSASNEGKAVPWITKGFDSGHNYLIGVCLSPIKKTNLKFSIKDGLNASEVGAFFIDPASGQYVLMGQYSESPVFRGRKLTLTYSNGSYCDSIKYANGERVRRKTILTFTCDRDMMSKAHVSYVAAVDDCTYLFEFRSDFACPTAAKADNFAAIWIFLLIFLAALMVFFSGGFLYRPLKR